MNCDQTSDEDTNSVVSERCWEEKYCGDSRKWLVRDGSNKKSRGGIFSAMKESFVTPEYKDPTYVGKRRSLLREKLLEEIAKEIIEENNQPAPIEEYCTEYDGNFNYPCFDPNKKDERDKELFLKYPLYTSEAVTYYKFQLDKAPLGQVSIIGHTAIKDLKSPFKRNSNFSKPLSEVLDTDSL